MKIKNLLLQGLPALVCPALALSAPNPPPLGSPESLGKTIPIVAWYGIPTKFNSVERYKEMAAAGFTMCVPPEGNTETVRQHLDFAAQAGIKLILQENRMLTDPAAVAADFKNNPGLGMYFLKDEPTEKIFARLAEVKNTLAQEDPQHLSWINLYPNHATAEQMGLPDYATYVERYLEVVRPAFLSYDNYGVFKEKEKFTLSPSYYANLEQISKEARAEGKPFWAFIQTTAFGSHGVTGEAALRLQAFSSLAYGARGIEYFTYWTPLPEQSDSDFHDGPISRDGTRTPLLDLLTILNKEIQVLTPTLVGLKPVGVGHFNPQDPSVTEFTPSHGVVSVGGVSSASAVLGFLEGIEGEPWLLVVNRSFEKAGEFELTMEPEIRAAWETSKVTGEQQSLAKAEKDKPLILMVKLAPGDGRLFKLSKTGK